MALTPRLKLTNQLKQKLLELANLFEQNQRAHVEKQQLLGLGATVLALPLVATHGLKPALGMLGFGLYQMHKAKQKEHLADQVAKLRQEFAPDAPRPNFPRPKPRFF